MLREAESEYKDLLKQLEEDENVTKEDLENFKKNALIHKSVLEVRRRAQAQQDIRSSPERYYHVDSKIAQNMQTQKKISSSKNFNGDLSVIGNSQTIYFDSKKYVVSKREHPFEITEEEFARRKGIKLNTESTAKINQRDDQIYHAEEYLQSLQRELKERRPLHEKLQAYRDRDPSAIDINQVLQVANHTKTQEEILNFDGNAKFLEQIPADDEDEEDQEAQEVEASGSQLKDSDYQPRQSPPPQPVQQNLVDSVAPGAQVKAEVNVQRQQETKSVTRKSQPKAQGGYNEHSILKIICSFYHNNYSVKMIQLCNSGINTYTVADKKQAQQTVRPGGPSPINSKKQTDVKLSVTKQQSSKITKNVQENPKSAKRSSVRQSETQKLVAPKQQNSIKSPQSQHNGQVSGGIDQRVISDILREMPVQTYADQQDGSIKFIVDAPAGTDGCVMFVERRSRPASLQYFKDIFIIYLRKYQGILFIAIRTSSQSIKEETRSQCQLIGQPSLEPSLNLSSKQYSISQSTITDLCLSQSSN